MADFLGARPLPHTVSVKQRNWLSNISFELVVEKPRDFNFLPGQKVLIEKAGVQREYSLACSPDAKDLHFCIRFLAEGTLSTILAEVQPGAKLKISEAYGFFIYRPGNAIFIATGTGIAPFVAYAQSGIQGFLLLHGVASVEDLYFRQIVEKAAKHYVPCLSDEDPGRVQEAGGIVGRVTEYLAKSLSSGVYDFYLCGNGAMIGEATCLIDRNFPDSRVFTESFFSG